MVLNLSSPAIISRRAFTVGSCMVPAGILLGPQYARAQAVEMAGFLDAIAAAGVFEAIKAFFEKLVEPVSYAEDADELDPAPIEHRSKIRRRRRAHRIDNDFLWGGLPMAYATSDDNSIGAIVHRNSEGTVGGTAIDAINAHFLAKTADKLKDEYPTLSEYQAMQALYPVRDVTPNGFKLHSRMYDTKIGVVSMGIVPEEKACLSTINISGYKPIELRISIS